jgi:hypothetical protein
MALQKNIEKFGLVFENAYIRIGECKYYNNLYPYTSYPEPDFTDPDNPQHTPAITEYIKTRKYELDVHTYVNEQAFLSQSKELDLKSYSFFLTSSIVDSNNPLEIGYAYLKTLPEYSGSIDI